MKYALECLVDSTMKIPTDTQANWDGKTVLFLPNEAGVFAKIRIIADVSDPSTCRVWYEVNGSAPQAWHIHMSSDKELHNTLIADLQALESGLACQCPVSRIRWHSARIDFIPETPEEQDQIKANYFQLVPGADQPEQISECNIEKFVAGVHIADKCRDLVGPLSFLREGNNFFNQFRNIQAFFNFYFVLEGLYGGGHYEARKIKPKFLQSKILTSALEQEIRRGFPKPFRGGNQDIETMLKRINKPATVEGLVHLVVHARGDLHHFLDPTKYMGTPLTDDQFECLAKLTGSVAMTALTEEVQSRLPTS